MTVITSAANPAARQLKNLQDKAFRDGEGLYFAEGVNIVKDIPKDVRLHSLYFKESRAAEFVSLNRDDTVSYVLSDSLFDRLADTVSPSGVIAVIYKPLNGEIAPVGRAVILDGISDPGNTGTIIRTAAAAGVKTVYCAGGADPYSPKAVRASMGGVTRLKIITAQMQDILNALKTADYILYALDMGGKSVYGKRAEERSALAVGSEAHGLSIVLREAADEILSLPMSGEMESLNAAAAAAAAMYILYAPEKA